MHQAFTAKCQLGPFFNWLGFLVQFISLVFYVYYTQACRQAFCRQYYAYLHYAVLAPKVSSVLHNVLLVASRRRRPVAYSGMGMEMEANAE